MTNQEALDQLCCKCVLIDVCDCVGTKPYCEAIETIQNAINELQNLKENYIGFEDMNYELKVYKKAYDLLYDLLVMTLIIGENEIKQSILDKAKEELNNEKNI